MLKDEEEGTRNHSVTTSDKANSAAGACTEGIENRVETTKGHKMSYYITSKPEGTMVVRDKKTQRATREEMDKLTAFAED